MTGATSPWPTTTAPAGAPAAAPGRRGARAAAWLLPVLALLAALVLTALNLNGSSVQMLGDKPASDPSLVLGQPRGIRSDEFRLNTPQAVGSDRRGLPADAWIGLTPTFLPATSIGAPTQHWTMAFKPRDWGYLVLPTNRAFAWSWWWQPLIGFVGVYWLAWLLGRRPLVAAALATAVVASPYAGWWSNNPSGVVGALATAAACAVVGLRSRRGLAAVGWGLLAGWFAVGGALILYPPWQVSLAWVLIAVIIGTALDRRVGWARLAQVAVAALAVLVPAMALWWRESATALAATTGTYYPGNRISTAGGTTVQRLLDAPSSLWSSTGYWVARPLGISPGERAVNGQALLGNSSEMASTWLPLPLLAAALVAAVWALMRARRTASPTPPAVDPVVDPVDGAAAPDVRGTRDTAGPWTLGLLAAVELVLLAWALLPLPDWIGAVTLLNRVPGYRTPLALGLGLVLLLAAARGALTGQRLPWWLTGLLAAGAALSVAGLVWGTDSLHWARGHGPGLKGVAAVATAVTVGFALVLAGRRLTAALGAVLLAAGSLAVYAQINPLTRGLGVLERDPVVAALRPYVGDGRTRATVYGDIDLSAIVSSTGLQNLSGMTIYPDADLWRRLAPAQEPMWNNYAKYEWVADPTLEQPVIEQITGTQLRLRINPCAASTRELGITVSVSQTPLTGSCLVLDRTVPRPGGQVYVYRTAG